MAGSWQLRHRLQTWATEDPRLGFEDGDSLVAAAQRRDVSDWADRDQVLAALLERFQALCVQEKSANPAAFYRFPGVLSWSLKIGACCRPSDAQTFSCDGEVERKRQSGYLFDAALP